MSKAIIVSVNGVPQSPTDFGGNGHKIVFAHPPAAGDTVQFTTINGYETNTSSYYGTGIQTTFNLPAFPRVKFEIVKDSNEQVLGYTVVDVDTEIDLWIRENCPISDWKWADQLDEAIQFNMSRLIVKESIVTFIATKWSV